MPLRLVAGRPPEMAKSRQPGQRDTDISDVDCRQRCIPLDGQPERDSGTDSPTDTELARTFDRGGGRHLVLSGKAALAASDYYYLPALANRYDAVAVLATGTWRDRGFHWLMAPARLMGAALVFCSGLVRYRLVAG